MIIIEIAAKPNGGHNNQTGEFKTIPEGWAVIPDNIETPNFPFGKIKTKKVNGVETVTSWTAGEIPQKTRKGITDENFKEVVTHKPADIEALVIEHEYRLILLEMGVTE